jgi:hypothetical protein
MRISLGRVLAFAVVWLVPTLVHAQGGVLGSIVGNVYDQSGQPLKGVKVVATSETQIGGPKTTYTNDEGFFRIPTLQPGMFEVIASAPKMNSVHQKGLKVGVNAPTEVSLVMDIETAQEEVKVVEKAPIVSTSTANVKEVYDEEFIDNLPLETRTSVEELVGNASPGAVNAGDRLVRVRGGNTRQNIYLVDGFEFTGLKTIYKSLSAMEVQTAGYGAEGAAAAGGLVTMVTKSGSNKYELDVNGFHEDSLFRPFIEESDKVPRDWRMYINPNFSGPIIKDKVWFYVNGEARDERYSRSPDPTGFFPQPPTQHYWNTRATTKVTWQATPRNKLQSFTFIDKNYSRNRIAAYNTDRDAQQKRDRYAFFTGLTWESLFRDDLFFKTQVGYTQMQEEIEPQQCLTNPDCDNIPAIVQSYPQTINLNNYSRHYLQDIKGFEFVNTLEWFGHTARLGDHDVKLVSRYYTRREEWLESTPGDKIIRYNGGMPDRLTTFYANDPRLAPERFGWNIRTSNGYRWSTALQDSARLTRYLTITPGIALTATSSGNSKGETVTEGASVTPHVALAWDATHDGRTVVRGSFNNYVDPDVGRLSRHTLGTPVTRECTWNATVGDFVDSCRYSGGASNSTVGLPCGPQGYDERGRPCREKLRVPRTWEYTVGAEREIMPGVGLGGDFVFRDYTYPYSTKESNRIWNASGSALDPTGSYRNGRAETFSDLETPSTARRKYQGITGAIHKREGGLKMSASYTWSRTWGNAFDTEDNAWGEIPPRDMFLWGYMPDDARHVIKTTLTYRWTRWLSTGALYQYFSGRPYNRMFRNVQTGGYDDLRAPVGINPGGNINDPGDDRDLRLPDMQYLNLQIRTNLKSLINYDVELYTDIMNVLSLRTTTSVVVEDGPRFGQPADRQGPMSIRLGFRFRY